MGGYNTPEAQRRRYRRIRTEVLHALGKVCACCGEDEFEFLTLDHINSDGAEQRKARKGRNGGDDAQAAWSFHRRTGSWPNDLRVLCFNCNVSAFKGDGLCVHQRPTGA